MEIPILNQREDKQPLLLGASKEGIVEDGPVLLSQLLNLMDKARFAAAANAANLGCTEYSDSMMYSTSVEITGLFIFARSLEDIASELITEDDQMKNFSILLAHRCCRNIQMMNQYIDRLKGFSEKAKKRFSRDLKEFVIQTMAKNIQGFTTNIASIIQS